MRRLALVACALLAASCRGSAGGSPPVDGRFTIAVIPDTQNYVDYTHQTAAGFPFDASEMFLEQMAYVAANVESAAGEIAFVTALGDMWQHQSLAMDPVHAARGFRRVDNPLFGTLLEPTAQTRAFEMPLVKRGYELIAGRVPFSVVPGNHDYDAMWTDANHPPAPERKDALRYGILHAGGLVNFASIFSDKSEFFRDQAWYVASHDEGADSAQVFDAGGYRFLHLGLQLDPPNATLEWAASIIERHPGLPTIVSTHNYLDPSGERIAGPIVDNHAADPDDNTPQMVWEKLISRHDQIFMVLSGHRTASAFRVEPNRAERAVYQLLSDYQDRRQTTKAAGGSAAALAEGVGDGWMRLMMFDLGAATPSVRVRTYSTHYKAFSTDLPEYAAWYKASEKPDVTDAEFLALDDFDIELRDFRDRFARSATRR